MRVVLPDVKIKIMRKNVFNLGNEFKSYLNLNNINVAGQIFDNLMGKAKYDQTYGGYYPAIF